LQVGDTGPVESARRSNSRVLGSPFSGLSGHPQTNFTPPMVFLDFRFLHQELKVGEGLALFTLYLCLPLKEALFFLFLHFIEFHL
jgi:hypothetical protein